MSPVALALLLASCGAAGEGGPCGGSAGPDVSAVREQVLESINLEAEGAARIVEFEEVGREGEGRGDFQSCLVRFAGEIEFTRDSQYYMRERRSGERTPFDAEAEFIKDQTGWKRGLLGVDPR